MGFVLVHHDYYCCSVMASCNLLPAGFFYYNSSGFVSPFCPKRESTETGLKLNNPNSVFDLFWLVFWTVGSAKTLLTCSAVSFIHRKTQRMQQSKAEVAFSFSSRKCNFSPFAFFAEAYFPRFLCSKIRTFKHKKKDVAVLVSFSHMWPFSYKKSHFT